MNARQRAKFEAKYGTEPYSQDGTEDFRGKLAGWNMLRTVYSAACQDETEAVKGLVEALEMAANGLRHCARWNISEEKEKAIMAHVMDIEQRIKAWKGE